MLICFTCSDVDSISSDFPVWIFNENQNFLNLTLAFAVIDSGDIFSSIVTALAVQLLDIYCVGKVLAEVFQIDYFLYGINVFFFSPICYPNRNISRIIYIDAL